MARLIMVLLLVVALATGCDKVTLPRVNVNDNDSTPNTNDDTPSSNDNTSSPPDTDEPNNALLPVSISGSNLAAPDELLELEAHVQDSDIPPSASYFYSWEYRLENSGAGQAPISESDPFVEDWTRITFQPQDYGAQIGDRLVVSVIVQELVAGLVRRSGNAQHEIVVSDARNSIDEDGQDNEQGQDDGPGQVDEPITDDDEIIEGDGEEESGEGAGGGGAAPLTIQFDQDQIAMSLAQEILPIAPVISGGAQPYTYDWTPIDVLQPSGGAFSSDISVIDSSEVEFVPDAVGDYEIELTVTDAEGEILVDTLDITVNDYAPLTASAGPDLSGAVGSAMILVGAATGGSGDYGYLWTPGNNISSSIFANTNQSGVTTYTLIVTDQETGAHATDSAQVVVYTSSSSSCTANDIDMGVSSAKYVAYDPGYGTAGQAIAVSGNSVYIYDLSDDSLRNTLTLPASGRSLALDVARRRGFVSTQITNQFTRSVQVIDLDTPALECNIALAASTTVARGMDVIPSTGEVLIAVAGADHGLIKVDPGACSAHEALQELHNPGSFREPIDVAVLEENGLSVAVVANGGTNKVTLVPLAMIVETPDAAGGTGMPLAQVLLSGTPRAIVADPSNDRAIVSWNLGVLGRLQTVEVEKQSGIFSGSAGVDINVAGAVIDQGLSIDTQRNEVYAAMGGAGAAVVNLSFAAQTMTLQALNTPALSVVAEFEHGVDTEDTVLIVGQGPSLSQRCP